MEDLTGKRYGNLIITGVNEEETKVRSERYGKRTIVWNAKCTVCSLEKIILKSQLKTIEKRGTTGCENCNKEDLTGKRVGRLTVRCKSPNQVPGKVMWILDCDCGNVVEHETGLINAKNAPQSCGCLQREAASRIGKETIKKLIENNKPLPKDIKRLHTIWSNMKQRCENPNNQAYDYYGGRGIKVCDEWHDIDKFEEWALNNGYQSDLTIDRIDTNGNYEPSNCRWITQKEQSNNTRKNKLLTYNGKTQSLSDWCEELGLDYFRTKARLNACGYSVEDAFEKEKYYFQKNVQHKKPSSTTN